MRIVIKRPIVTEKTVQLAETLNKYTFEVTMDASKTDAISQLKEIFGVSGNISVNSSIRMGKKTGRNRFGVKQGRRNHMKIMVFTLPEGQTIDLFNQ